MRRGMTMVVGLLASLVLAACASKMETGRATEIPTDPVEKLIWSSAPQRPAWVLEEPGASDGQLWFVGLSEKFSTERQAREDARRSATAGVVKYMGTLVNDKFERLRVTYGLEGDVTDPTTSIREYEKQLSVNMATRVKMKTWYEEKWQTPTGVANVAFVLAHVPESALDETSRETARNMAQDAERRAKEAGDAVARQQAEKAAEFWKEFEEQKVTE